MQEPMRLFIYIRFNTYPSAYCLSGFAVIKVVIGTVLKILIDMAFFFHLRELMSSSTAPTCKVQMDHATYRHRQITHIDTLKCNEFSVYLPFNLLNN